MDNDTPVETTDNVTPVSTEAGAGSLLNNTEAPAEAVKETVVTETPAGSTWDDFVGTLDDDIKDYKGWEKFNSPQELAKSYKELEGLVGKKGEIPKADAPPEEWNEFYGKLGRPETPADYGIGLKDGLTEGADRLNDGLKLAHELGISKTQAEGLFNGMMDRELQDAKGIQDQFDSNMKAEQAKLSDTWGNGMDDMIESVTRLEKSLGVFDAFEAKGLNADADLLIMMGEMAKRMNEDPEISTGVAKTPAGLDNSISEVNQQIKEYLTRGEKVPVHLTNKRSELFDKKYQ